MRWIDPVIGSFVEAWSEVKAQKARVILSLVGVVVAVTAMTTVIALGDILVQSQQEMNDAYSGRPVTLNISVTSETPDQIAPGDELYRFNERGELVDATQTEPAQVSNGETTVDNQIPVGPIATAMAAVAQRFEIPYWARTEFGYLSFPFMDEITTMGTFQGVPVPISDYGYQEPQITAVDPDYAIMFRLQPEKGRWLKDSDWEQKVTPIVINQALWDMLGSPDFERTPLILDIGSDPLQQARVVGMVPNKSSWDAPLIYMTFNSWQFLKPAGEPEAPTMVVWASPEQADQARIDIPRALSALLGEGWTSEAWGGESWQDEASAIQTLQMAVIAIGALVIFLGALGLLNVAVVTVRQRMREIGIRRAMGASSGRVFFSVFMESVVATFVAGIIGVGMAVVIVRFIPLESVGIFLQDVPPFPARAALVGVSIATCVGALCGLVPALAATRVKPIEAIRS